MNMALIPAMLKYYFFLPFDQMLVLFMGRLFFAAAALACVTGLVRLARKKCSPRLRSWLWALCLPTLFIPFERSLVILVHTLSVHPLTYVLFYPVWRYVWLAGVIVSVVITRAGYKKTLRLIKQGRVDGCASYFYRGKSRVYTPPDFAAVYSSQEQALLLAHERQHIKQHDPLLYRFLLCVKCVFWFNPPVHKAVRLVRQDRELLCDERVTRGCSKLDYGRLLLSEAKKSALHPALAGMIPEPSGVYERIRACAKPFAYKKTAAAAVALVSVLLFTAGLPALVKPVVESPMKVNVYRADDAAFTNIPGFEKYIFATSSGTDIDEEGFYEYALAMGYEPDQEFIVDIIDMYRPFLFAGGMTTGIGDRIKLAELNTKEISIPCSYNNSIAVAIMKYL